MKPINSDILKLLQRDSTKYVRCRKLLQRMFILSINYLWQMAPSQPECRKGKIPVIPARTQNFAQPLVDLSKTDPITSFSNCFLIVFTAECDISDSKLRRFEFFSPIFRCYPIRYRNNLMVRKSI